MKALWLGMLLVALATGTAASAADGAPRCPGDRTLQGDVGLRALRCEGPAASCAINLGTAEGHHHRFAVEPTVVATAPGSPARAALREGDVLVAVDGRLITTAEGGRYLANLEIGGTIELLLRRGGELRAVRLAAQPGCGVTSLTVAR